MVDGDGVDKDAIWTAGADEDDDVDAPAVAPDEVGTDAEADADADEEGTPPSSWNDEDDAPPNRTVLIAQISLVVLVLIGVGVILAVKSNNNDKPTGKSSLSSDGSKTSDGGTGNTGGKPKKAAWPPTVTNRPVTLGKRNEKAPAVKSTAKPGVYVWIDYDGWHMWVVGGAGMPSSITGSIISSDVFARADVATPGAGTTKLNGKQVTFDVPTDKPITGVDFNPGFYAKQLVFDIEGDAGPLDSKLIHLGGKAVAAPFPLTVSKA